MKLQKFENVDVIASLEAIMKQNTAAATQASRTLSGHPASPSATSSSQNTRTHTPAKISTAPIATPIANTTDARDLSSSV